MPYRLSHRAKLVMVPVAVVAALNFVAFFCGDVWLGGSAQNGYAKDGHYFLGSHGRYTEVTKTVWTYSCYHGTSVLMTHGSFFLLVVGFLITGDMVLGKERRPGDKQAGHDRPP